MDISGQLVLWTWSLYVGLPSCPQSTMELKAGSSGMLPKSCPVDGGGLVRLSESSGPCKVRELIVRLHESPQELLLFSEHRLWTCTSCWFSSDLGDDSHCYSKLCSSGILLARTS